MTQQSNAALTLADPSALIGQLRAALVGFVIAPGDEGYDEGRATFYGGMDRRPALIVRAANASDVSQVVSVACSTGMEISVRSGGHSGVGHSVSEGGIMLDLREMKAIEIDAEARTAWAETGMTAGEFTSAVAEYGLAVGFGDTGSVGIGGITLGGGVGYLVRKHGLTIDSLLAAEIVTADGTLLRVDAGNYPDLFWAIRGGGGNFGVVTRFKYRLHEVGPVVGGMMLLPATPETIAGFIAQSEAAPEELSTIANVMPAPPMPFVPDEYHGKLVIMAMFCYAGDPGAGHEALERFRAIATPIVDMVRPIEYPEMYPPDEEDYHPTAMAHSMFINQVDRDVAETILEHLQASTASMAVAQLRVLGGAMARVPVEETAFAHRKSRIMANLAAIYEDAEKVDEYRSQVNAFAAAMDQGDSGVYVNFLLDEGEARVRAAYPGKTWDRLLAVKERYDPTNLFRLNQNIQPAQ